MICYRAPTRTQLDSRSRDPDTNLVARTYFQAPVSAPSVWNSLPLTVLISDSLFLNPDLKLFCSIRLLPNTDPTCCQRLWSYDRMALYKFYYYAPPLIGGGIKRWCCLTSVWLSVWRLTSVAYIGPKSPCAGSGVVRMDPLRFLAGCCTRRLNQV